MEDISSKASKGVKGPLQSPQTGTKKLKQACLPFKVLSAKPVTENTTTNINSPTNSNQKKRKLSDDTPGPVKASKTPRSEDKTKTPKAVVDENEVSSSSEPENKHKNDKKVSKPKPVGLMDKFIQSAQQQEVTTSTKDDPIDLTDDSEAEPKSVSEEDGKSEEKQESAEETMEVDCVEDEAKDDEDESINESKEEDKSEVKEDDEKKDGLMSPPAAQGASKAKTPGSNRKTTKSKEEREKLQKEKEMKKQKEKEEKERKLKEKEEQKKKEKEEKERLKEQKKKEKELEKERKEKEKEEKKKQAEEEKKAKAEKKRIEQEQKEEEKKRKAEEKRQEQEKAKEAKEAEKNKEKEEKKQVSEKQKALMQSFFTKQQKKDMQMEAESSVGGGASGSLFMPFQCKSDTRLAPLHRVERDEVITRLDAFDQLFISQDHDDLYLSELKKKKTRLNGTDVKTFPFLISEDSSCMIMDEDKPGPSKQLKKERMHAKFLLFHENYRPAYFGTWRKHSKHVRPRAPFGKDTRQLEYEVESDEEWEEEEPGESLSDAENDEDKDEEEGDDDEEEDGFFVPHGYLSDGEGCEDDEEDATPERMKARQLAKAKAFEAEMNKKTEVLKPVVVGCYWQDQTLDLMTEVLQQFKMVMLGTAPTPLPIVMPGSDTSPLNKKGKKDKKMPKASNLQQVPEEALPDLIRLVHGNKKGMPKLIREFREFWRLKEAGKNTQQASEGQTEEADDISSSTEKEKEEKMETEVKEDGEKEAGEKDEEKEDKVYSISKRQLLITIKQMAEWDRKNLIWYVNDATLDKYKCKELPVPTEWRWITIPQPKFHKPDPASQTATPNGKEASGRLTPSMDKTPKGGCSIKKFTVAGITPKPHSANSPVTPKPHIVLSTPRGSINMLFTGGAVPTPDTPNPAPKPLPESGVTPIMVEGEEEEEEEEDCAIISMDLKPDKNQPGIKSMFKAVDKLAVAVDASAGKEGVGTVQTPKAAKSAAAAAAAAAKNGGSPAVSKAKTPKAKTPKAAAAGSAAKSKIAAAVAKTKTTPGKATKVTPGKVKTTPAGAKTKAADAKTTPGAKTKAADAKTTPGARVKAGNKTTPAGAKTKQAKTTKADKTTPASKEGGKSLTAMKVSKKRMSIDDVMQKINSEAENLKRQKVEKVAGEGTEDCPMEID